MKPRNGWSRVVCLCWTSAVWFFAATVHVPFAVAQLNTAEGQPPSRTASIVRGRVIAADTGRPLRRVTVTLRPLDRRAAQRLPSNGRTTPLDQFNRPFSISTSSDGRFEIRDVPAGRYTVTADRSGYLSIQYGQARPLETGKPLQVLENQIIDRIDFALPRMSVIAGRVTDDAGEPISGARVFVLRQQYAGGQRRMIAVANELTDDTGQYRITGASPSSYYLVATLGQTWTIVEDGTEQHVGFSATYFPGTTNPSGAQRVAVGVAQQVAADMSLVRGRTVTVSGTAVSSNGAPLRGETVYVVHEMPGTGLKASDAGGALVTADGTFTIQNLPPGDLKLVMRYGTSDGGAPHVHEAASVRVAPNGADVRNLRIVTSRGGTAAGQVLTDRGEIPGIPRDQIRVLAVPVAPDADLKVGGIDDSGVVNDDGTFYVGGLFGPTRLRAELPDGWTLKSVLRDGRDITDQPIEAGSGQRISNIQVIITERVTAVTGRVLDDRNAPLLDGTVIMFSIEPEKWSDDTRYIRAVRLDQQGQFTIAGAPPGDYQIVGVAAVEDGGWNDPAYLDSMRRYARRVSLREGGTESVALKVIVP